MPSILSGSRRLTSTILIRLAAVPLVVVVMGSATGSYAVRTVTALVAATVLLRSARHRTDRLVRAPLFFAAALLVGVGSGLASAGYLLVVGHPAQIGWFSDWLYLSYAPLAVVGVLAVPRASTGRGGTTRALADGAVAAGSMWYLVMVLLIGPRHMGADLAPLARGVTLAFPLLPIFVVAVILSALPRVSRPMRPFLYRAAAGVFFLGVGDVAVAVASWGGWYNPASWIAAISQLGLLLMLDAACLDASSEIAVDTADAADNDVDATPCLLVVGAPYAPLMVALVLAVERFVTGHGLAHQQVGPVLLIGAAVIVRHLASARETGHLVSRLATREQLAWTQAMTDPLTGLANRTSFLERLESALQGARSHPVAVALLDLNDFKDINDTHGHDTGDSVLRQIADRLQKSTAGTVARLGGDEFAAFMPTSTDGGHGLADAITSAFTDPVVIGSRPFQVRASVGVVLDERPVGGARPGDAAQLLAHADVAMYEAKNSKSIQTTPVSVLTGRARATAAATIRIREEIGTPDLSQFQVVYQPIVDLGTGAIVGAEALLRWHHPDFGPISPVTFIPLAERVGSITALGNFVLTVALDDLATWTAAGNTTSTVGVNMSPHHLADSDLASTVVQLLSERDLDPGRLTLEVTEEAFVDDLDALAGTIDALRAVGISIAVDDFGTGYSSLRYLRRLDVNIVKIDREFVQAASTEPRTDALVHSVVSMATALDLICVAEGIETLEQLERVRSHGCQQGQGFLLARPMPAEALGQLLAAGHIYPVDVHTPAHVVRRPLAPVIAIRGGN